MAVQPRLALSTSTSTLYAWATTEIRKKDDDGGKAAEEEIRGVEKEKSLVANRITLIELNCYYIYKDEQVDDN